MNPVGRVAWLRRFLLVVKMAFRLVWSADKRAFQTIVVLAIVGGVGLGAELLVGRRLLTSIGSTSAGQPHGTIGDIVPELVLLGVLAMLIAVANAVEQRRARRS